jgi:predicted mannosyl-3-phosphoglycerate phosphatase (HAD superfamily)
MKYSISSIQDIGEVRANLEAILTSARSPEETLEILDKIGLEPFVTEEGDSLVRVWTIAAEDFIPREEAAIIRTKRGALEKSDSLDWLSKNLPAIRGQYAGEWIAVYEGEVIDHATALPELLGRISEFDKPLVTFIPAEPVTWTFTYAQ